MNWWDRPLYEFDELWVRISGLILWGPFILIHNTVFYMIWGILNTIKAVLVPIYKGRKPYHLEELRRQVGASKCEY